MSEQSWLQILTDYLAEQGQRLTKQRKVIAETFINAEGHPSVEDIYEKVRGVDESIGQATVYRTAKLLVDAGLVSQSRFKDGSSRYEAFDRDHHDHLVCLDCGLIVEFHNDIIEREQVRLATSNSFIVEDHEMVIYGRCQLTPCPRAREKNDE